MCYRCTLRSEKAVRRRGLNEMNEKFFKGKQCSFKADVCCLNSW